MKKDLTEIVFILDRSGSMSGLESDTVGGFNAMIAKQKSCLLYTSKLGSSLIFVVRPLLYAVYVKKHYHLPKMGKGEAVLTQKWTGISQHIAYFLHTNTDVVLLTLFANARLVAVYAVYSMVVSSIRAIAEASVGGMEAVSYTHLDVYKRQALSATRSSLRRKSSLPRDTPWSLTPQSSPPAPSPVRRRASTCLLYTSGAAGCKLLAEAAVCGGLGVVHQNRTFAYHDGIVKGQRRLCGLLVGDGQRRTVATATAAA